MYKNLIEVPY